MPSDSFRVLLEEHPYFVGSLFVPESYQLRSQFGVPLRAAGDETFLWIPKTPGGEITKLSSQRSREHARIEGYDGGFEVGQRMLFRVSEMADFARYESSLVASASSSSAPSFAATRKRDAMGDLVAESFDHGDVWSKHETNGGIVFSLTTVADVPRSVFFETDPSAPYVFSQ